MGHYLVRETYSLHPLSSLAIRFWSYWLNRDSKTKSAILILIKDYAIQPPIMRGFVCLAFRYVPNFPCWH